MTFCRFVMAHFPKEVLHKLYCNESSMVKIEGAGNYSFVRDRQQFPGFLGVYLKCMVCMYVCMCEQTAKWIKMCIQGCSEHI